MEYNMLNKEELTSELRYHHKKLVNLYEDIFNYKYNNDEEFKNYINNQYGQNNISKKNQKNWNQNFCHRASYTLLNKILFVRICEDKGFMRNPEDYIAGQISNTHIGEKLSKVGLQKWTSIIKNSTFGELINFAFLDMKKSYNNISLYKDDKYEILNPTDEELNLKYLDCNKNIKGYILKFEKIIGDILAKLDTERFDFAKTDSNILGDVYEEFMDRETRKAIGQFYTPEFVIEYILKNTVTKSDIVENPFVKVADISCGSGHFLIMAYDILREKFINNLEILRSKYSKDKYIIKRNGKEEEVFGEEYWVEENIHYHLLKHCIYGADIDSFAIQLTTINLLLKDLDNFTDQLNVIECDSLIKWEKDYDWEKLEEEMKEEFVTIEFKEVNMFGEEVINKKTIKKEKYTLKYRNEYGVKKKELVNKSRAEEIIKICQFWNKDFDYIIGNPPYIPITQINEMKKEYYKENYNYSEGRINTFSLFIERGIENKKNNKLGYIIPSRILLNTQYSKIRELLLFKTELTKILDLSEGIFEDAVVDTIVMIINNVLPNENIVQIEKYDSKKITKRKVLQSIYLNFENSYINIYVNEKEIELLNKIKKQSITLGSIADIKDGIIQGAVGDELFLKKNKVDSDKCKKVLYGRNINKYDIEWKNEYIDYDKDKLTLIENERTKGRGRGLRLRNPEIFERPKILTRQTADKVIAGIDLENHYYMNTLHGTYIKDQNYDIYYILAVLNSSIMNFYYTRYNYEVGKTFAQVKIQNLRILPIIKLDSEQQKILIKLSKKLVTLNKDYKILKYELRGSKDNILKNFLEIEEKKSFVRAQISKIIIDIDFYLYKVLKLSKQEIETIEKVNNEFTNERKCLLLNDKQNYDSIRDDVIKKAKDDIKLDQFIKFFSEDNSLEDLCKKYNYEYATLDLLRRRYLREFNGKRYILYNFKELIKEIYKVLRSSIKQTLRIEKRYLNLNDIYQKTYLKIDNFNSLIELIKHDDIEIKTEQAIQKSINLKKCNWEIFKKSKDDFKGSEIIEYDSNYYGLSEWSDEIHKHYFLDAIEEYTEIDPNEKKAKDILKLFKDLDIEDKNDYLGVIEGKINRVFK